MALILGYVAAGRTVQQIVGEFPDVTAEDVTAYLHCARDLADFEAVTTA